MFRIALKHILAGEFRGVEFGEAGNARETLDLVEKQDWAVVVLDITMPGRSGLDIVGELKQIRPKLPVLILTSQPEAQFAVRCLKAGADGYLNKETAAQELVGAVRQVMSGRKFVTASLAEKLAAHLSTDCGQPLHESLSNREFQILHLIASGKPLKEIGGELSLSIKTVSTYRARILTKLGLHTNTELVRYALRHELIQ